MDIEISNRNSDKFIPHPILDDPVRMMRIIANPVYDKLTLSRAAHIQTHNNSVGCVPKSVRMNRPKEKSPDAPLKALNSEETMMTPLPTNNNQSQSKSSSKRQTLPQFPLLTRSSTNRMSLKNVKLPIPSRTNSIRSSLAENDKKPITDGTIRYVNSRHGFEIQRYISSNWLSIDLLTTDACESEEKTFRDMLGKKEENDLSSRSIYTSEYYRQRWEDLLQSYKDGHLTHEQWARQNYQLHCLKTFYTQAFEREQYEMDLQELNQRQRRAQCIFNEWKEAKHEGNSENHQNDLNTANSQHRIEIASVSSNNSSSHHPNNTTHRMSVSSIVGNDLEELPVVRTINPSKNTKVTSMAAYMFDEQRWSLKAMLKRVVGLAEPLPPPPKLTNRQHSALTNLSSDSGFESGP